MRFFEGVLGVLLLLGPLIFLTFRSSKLPLAITTLSGALFLIHVMWEGARLQSMPLYGALVLVVCCSFLTLSRIATVVTAATASCFAGVGLLGCYLYPVMRLPRPDGPYAIGTRTFYLTDASRKEFYLKGGGDKRRVAAQVWYPAADCTGPRSPYRDPGTLASGFWAWGSRFYSSNLVETHACTQAPILDSSQRWPIVFVSPAVGGYRSQLTYLTELLASRGYIVVGMDHPGTEARVRFPDGFVAESNPDGWFDVSSFAALARTRRRTEAIISTNVEDIRFVYEQLRLGTADPAILEIGRRADLSRPGVVGYSFGGADAAELCRRDARFRAGVNMDGWMTSKVYSEGVSTPFLFMIEDDPAWFKGGAPYGDNSDGVSREFDQENYQGIRRSVNVWGGYIARIIAARHETFADAALRLRVWPWQGGPSAERLHSVISNLVLAFFDEWLKDNHGELLRVGAQFRNDCDLSGSKQPGRGE